MADKQSREIDFIVDENGVAKDVRNPKGLSIELAVDVSEALTGLKALQREAKEATKALRELEAEAKRELNVHLNISPSQTKVMGVEQITEIFEKLSEAKRNR